MTTETEVELEGWPLAGMVFRVIDTEGTSRDPSSAGVCEVAFVDVDDSGTEHMRFEGLFNPGHPIPPDSSAVHHITDEDVADKPHVSEMADILLAEVFVAHCAPYDAVVLGLESDALWLDTERLAKHLWPDIASYGVQEIRYTLGLKPDVPKRGAAHTAMFDALTTASILVAGLAAAREKWPHIQTVEQLISEVEKPVLLKRIPFKSAHGQLFEHAETSHLEWICSSGAGGPDCVHTARHWLEQRGSEWRDPDSEFYE